MKIKVQCACETRFEFEVEPVNERMPVPINCPVCGADATELANTVIRQQLATPVAAAAIPRAPAISIPVQPDHATPAAPAPSIPRPVAAAGHAPQPPQPPAPTPSQPAGGLRINKPAAHAAPAPAVTPAAGTEAVATSANLCPKHKTEEAIETCRVCGKPMCQKCMEMFGYVCSVYCRGQANSKKLDIPVYANQRSVVEQKARGKSKLIAWSIGAAVMLFIGAWFWYAWFGQMPKVVYAIKFAKHQAHGRYQLIGPGQLLSIKDKQMSLFDVAHQKELWKTTIVTEEKKNIPEAKSANAAAKPFKAKSSDADAVKTEVTRQLVKEKVQNTNKEENALEGDSFDFFNVDDAGIQEVIPSDTDVWLLFHDRLARYDRQTGSRKEEIVFKPNVTRVSHDDAGILAVSMPDKDHRILTQISLPAGTVQTEEIDLSPPKPKQAVAKTGDKSKKPVATPTKKVAAPVVAQPATTDGADGSEGDFANSFFADRDHFIATGVNVAELNVKLLERKVEVHEAMKPKGKSVLDSGQVTASQGLEVAQEMMNEGQRERTGGKSEEDVSRYQVTLHRWLAKGVADWTGEVIGPPALFPLKTVDIIAGGRSILVVDKNNKKLWDAKLTYPLEPHSHFDLEFGTGSAATCLEAGKILYFADQGMLTCFDLDTGNVRWRLTSVGISKIQLDDHGNIYLTTTSASPDSIQYSQQVSLMNRVEPVLLKVDPATGKVLWKVQKLGETVMLSGKYVYAGKESSSVALLRLEEGPDLHYNFYRLNPSNGHEVWNYFQTKPGAKAEVNQNWILLEFPNEIQVLKFLSL
jgi:outer membrane protein assembly factor BamB